MSRFCFEWNWWAINRPHLHFYRDHDGWGIMLSWGNGNSDPVWSIAYDGSKR